VKKRPNYATEKCAVPKRLFDKIKNNLIIWEKPYAKRENYCIIQAEGHRGRWKK
jgi:hypothetical protein